jgi:twinfilin-like protein
LVVVALSDRGVAVIRLETKNMIGWEWLLLHYAPDGSTVKDRMVYASTRDLLKRELGASYFGDDLFVADPAKELTPAAYAAHVNTRRGL